MERLTEMAYTIAISDLPSITNLLTREDVEKRVEFILKEWPLTKENYGVDTIEELVQIEIKNMPRCTNAYRGMSPEERDRFWAKVRYFDDLVQKRFMEERKLTGFFESI